MAVKQMIVMRKDLGMRRGKQIAQGAHASMAVLLNSGNFCKQTSETPSLGWFELPLTPDLHAWLTGLFTKVCVSVDSEDELLRIYAVAEQAGIPCALITDAGLTEFNGVPTKTCCAIGPASEEVLKPITGHLKLL